MSLVAGRLSLKVRAFLGFSRALQATLSIAQPAFAAVVALHGLPPAGTAILGLGAAAAGFFAVFALNDLLDVDLDRARFEHLRGYTGFDIDSTMSRHPLARRQLAYPSGLGWVGGLAALAFAGAYFLSPFAAALFLVAAVLEVVYCRLARLTAFKFLFTGAMVGFGALAGWVAVTSRVRPWEMALVFLWMFAWEIGGRNIVNDFADVEEDVRLGIKTVSVVYGPGVAARLTFMFLAITAAASLALELLSHSSLVFLAASAAAGLCLLIWPGVKLLRSPTPENAMGLFNRASFYPPVMLGLLLATLYLPFTN